MKEHQIEFAGSIRAPEVNKLLTSFWGEGSPIAHYEDPLISYDAALQRISQARALPPQAQKDAILAEYGGQTISLGMRYGTDLVVHSALLVQPWGDVETAGSIVAPPFKKMSLMDRINVRKKELLMELADLGLQPTTYVLLGSKSVEHGSTLFDIPELNMESYFCNIGPYVFRRKKDPHRFENSKMTELALQTDSEIISSSSQVIGLRKDAPPRISPHVAGELPDFWNRMVSFTPATVEDVVQTRNSQNAFFGDKASMEVHILHTPVEDNARYQEHIANLTKEGKTVLIKIPLTSNSGAAVEQSARMLRAENRDVQFIPTGLTLVDNYWSLSIASISTERMSHYTELLRKMDTTYGGGLQSIARLSLDYLLQSKG